jgi:hypothetical protein
MGRKYLATIFRDIGEDVTKLKQMIADWLKRPASPSRTAQRRGS